MLDHTPTHTSIELAPKSVATVSLSMALPERIVLRVIDSGAWSCFGLELTPDTARQLAAALVAHADAMQMHKAVKVAP